MADSTTVQQTNVNDLPEYVKPYYKALLNGVSGLTFAPSYMASQLNTSPPGSDYGGGNGQGAGTAAPPSYVADSAAAQSALPSAAAPTIPMASPAALIGSNATGPTHTINTDYTSQLSHMIDDIMSGGLFTRKPTGMAAGGVTPDPLKASLLGGNVSNVGIGALRTIGDTGAVPILTMPNGQTIFFGPNGPTTSSTPPALPTVPPNYAVQPYNLRRDPGYGTGPGSLWPATGGVPPPPGGGGGGGGGQGLGSGHPPGGQPPPSGGLQTPEARAMAGIVNGYSPFDSSGAAAMGYNPQQYASNNVADRIAQQFGGTVAHTQSAGANGPPSQNLVNIGGVDTNAGLDQLFLDIYGPEEGARKIAAAVKAGGGKAGGGLVGYADGGAVNPAGNGIFQPYQPYGGQRLLNSDPNADPSKSWTISPRTASAEAGLSSLPSTLDANGRVAGQLGDSSYAIQGAGAQTDNILKTLYGMVNGYNDPNSSLRSQYQAPTYGPTSFSGNQIDSSKLQMGSAGNLQMDPLNLYQQQAPRQWTDANVGSNYMDPYMRSVVDTQKSNAIQDFAESKSARDAQAVRAGAFGGSRQAVSDSLAHRDLQRQLGNIEATGDQNAYANAQQQFNADRAANMGASQNNLTAALQTQGLNTNAQLQAGMANQNTAANQFGQMYQGQLQSALANQQAGLSAQQLGEQSRQFGAGLENQGRQFADTQQLGAQELGQRLAQSGLGLGLQSQAQAGNLAVNNADLYRLANQMQIQNLQQQQGAGGAEDARRQAGLNLGYQDFLNQQNYPFQMSNFYSGILRGVPTAFNQDSVQIQQQNYNPLAQILGTGLGAYGTYKSGQTTAATGGAIRNGKVVPMTKTGDKWAYRGKGLGGC